MNGSDAIAVIDLEPWRARADPDTARTLVESLRRTGLVYVGGHGVPDDVMSEVFGAAHRFFSQDQEQLDAVHFRHSMHYRGWVPRGSKPPACHEMYDMGMNIPASYEGLGAELRTTPNLWPADLPGFRSSVERYQAVMRDLADSLLSAVAAGVSLPADFFRARCAQPHGHLRLLHYHSLPDNGTAPVSIGRHTDYEAVTILAQQQVGGLQVWDPAGTWLDVPPVDGTVVMNAGDMLARWTNGFVPAAEHRVATPVSGDRYAVAFFYATGYDVVIQPVLPSAVASDAYEPVTTGDFMYQRFDEEGGV